MAIKMRVNTKSDSVCDECGKVRKEVLDMFDVQIAGNIFTLCDVCNEALFMKTLKAECYKNGRVKSPKDIAIINQRGRAYWQAVEEKENKTKGTKESIKYEKEDAEDIKRKSSFLNGEE